MVTWRNVSNLYGECGSDGVAQAVRELAVDETTPETFYVHGFVFADLPPGNTLIKGVRVDISSSATPSLGIYTHLLKLTKDVTNPAEGSDNRGDISHNAKWGDVLHVWYVHGGPGSTWDYPLTHDEIKDVDKFGVIFACKAIDMAATPKVDCVTVTVYWGPGSIFSQPDWPTHYGGNA